MATSAGPSRPSLPRAPSRRRLRAAVEELRDEATRRKNLADRRAGVWAGLDIGLGLPAALLAAVSGTAGLATDGARVPAALAALASAGLAAGATFLRSERRRVANKRARQAWAAVEAGASVKLAQERVAAEDLSELYERRQAALGAYEGEAAQP